MNEPLNLQDPEVVDKILEDYKEGSNPSAFGKNENSQIGGIKMNDMELRQYCLELAIRREIELAKCKVTTAMPMETARVYYAWINSATSKEATEEK